MNEQLENMKQSMMNIIDCYETQMQDLKNALQEQIEVSETLREKIRIITQERDALKLLVKSYKEFLEFRNRKDRE